MRKETLTDVITLSNCSFISVIQAGLLVILLILFLHSFSLCPFLKIKSKNFLPQEEDSLALLFVGGVREEEQIEGRKFDGNASAIL